MVEDIHIRPSEPDDDASIIELMSKSLGWTDDVRHRELFAWKHRKNPFGVSPGWVAFDEHGLVGSRTLMRWRFQVDGSVASAVRAVDTATHPRARGRGIFRALTMTGVQMLADEGVDWVFNTPNDQSRPGYLSMGWKEMGRLPIAVRIPGPLQATRIVQARHHAGDLWSLPTSAGEDAAAVLKDLEGVAELLASQPRDGMLRTDRSVDYLRWRYGSDPVHYRVLMAGSSIREGAAFFRLRRRGSAVEAVIAELLLPRANSRLCSRLWAEVLSASGAHYAITVSRSRPPRCVALRSRGPFLTWRPLATQEVPQMERWDLCAGDVELF